MSAAHPASEPVVLRLFHGSRTRGIDALRASRGGEYGPGVYLTQSEDTARFYARTVASGPDAPVIYVVDARIEKPFVTTKAVWLQATASRSRGTVQRALIKKGYDAIVSTELSGAGSQIIVFDPSKVTIVSHSPGRTSGRSSGAGPSLGDVARIKVLGTAGRNEADAMIGHPFFFPGEKVVERLQTTAMVTGSREVVFVTITSMPDPVGYPTMGRVLLSYNEEASVSYGGFFFATSYKKKCIQSLYLVEEYRGGTLGTLLAELAKRLKISCVFEPISPAGRAWAGKHGFKIRKG